MTRNSDPMLDNPIPNDNWKPKVLIIGAALGAIIGLGTAYLLSKSSEEHLGGPPQITPGDALKLSVGVIGLVRGIAALGE